MIQRLVGSPTAGSTRIEYPLRLGSYTVHGEILGLKSSYGASIFVRKIPGFAGQIQKCLLVNCQKSMKSPQVFLGFPQGFPQVFCKIPQETA